MSHLELDEDDTKLTVIFSDNHCLAVSKEARQNTASDKSGDESLIAKVKRLHKIEREKLGKSEGYCVPIHFLDRPVSGVVLFATSSKAAARLNLLMQKHQIKKSYLAIVEAEVKGKSGTISSELVKDRKRNISMEVSKSGKGENKGEGEKKSKAAELSFEVVGRLPGKTLLLVRPKSGRSHQIRVQLSSRGWPIWGDKKYGATHTWMGQIALHAWRLEFEHPTKKEPCTLKAALPENWGKIWPDVNTTIKNLNLN